MHTRIKISKRVVTFTFGNVSNHNTLTIHTEEANDIVCALRGYPNYSNAQKLFYSEESYTRIANLISKVVASDLNKVL